MRNETEWQELYESIDAFNDADDPRYTQAWKWAEALQNGGRLTSRDVFSLQCLIGTFSDYSGDADGEPVARIVHENGPVVIDQMGDQGLSWRPLDYGTWTPLYAHPPAPTTSPDVASLRELLALADKLLMDAWGAYPLPGNPNREPMGLIRAVTGSDYHERKAAAARALDELETLRAGEKG